jgi:hypothetical protein
LAIAITKSSTSNTSDRRVAEPTTTLFVEDLHRLAAVLPADARYPVLERVLARGRPRRFVSTSPNQLRFELFGAEADDHLPVAALTHLFEHDTAEAGEGYWLRADPVSLRADMTRVFMTGCGFADYDAVEREAIERIVAHALSAEGIEVRPADNCWCFRLPAALPFEFAPLHEALGVDMAEVLPDHPEAATWKRLLTEIQVELHQCEVNAGRRERGRAEVNSVWFWGGGRLSAAVDCGYETVYSNDPVSGGLALQAGCALKTRDEANPGKGSSLVDWTMDSADAPGEAAMLERLVADLVSGDGPGRVLLVDGRGRAWQYDRAASRRFWQRPRALAERFGGRAGGA